MRYPGSKDKTKAVTHRDEIKKVHIIKDEQYETEIVWNSNLMIPDFPLSIRIRFAPPE